jgi:hypothetical protein
MSCSFSRCVLVHARVTTKNLSTAETFQFHDFLTLKFLNVKYVQFTKCGSNSHYSREQMMRTKKPINVILSRWKTNCVHGTWLSMYILFPSHIVGGIKNDSIFTMNISTMCHPYVSQPSKESVRTLCCIVGFYYRSSNSLGLTRHKERRIKALGNAD